MALLSYVHSSSAYHPRCAAELFSFLVTFYCIWAWNNIECTSCTPLMVTKRPTKLHFLLCPIYIPLQLLISLYTTDMQYYVAFLTFLTWVHELQVKGTQEAPEDSKMWSRETAELVLGLLCRGQENS